jgi:Tol biopolymer transport system component/DNA-binding winged helix-turn-helix (wHTH) protein
VRFGIFEADLRTGELRKSGTRLRIQSQPFRVLAVLLENPGEVVTREELQRRLWGDGTVVDFDHSLGTAVNKLREVLGDSAENPRFVETLAKRGYRFIAPVDAAARPVPPLAAPAAAEPRPEQRIGRRGRVAAVVLALAAAALILHTWLGRRPMPQLVRASQITWSGHISPGDMALENFPGLTTDGTRIYFQETRQGRTIVAQSSITEGDTRVLPTPPEIAGPSLGDISPDGSRLLIRNHLAPELEQPLWIVPTTGGAARRVLSALAHDATWTPDGQSILYASGHDFFLTRNDGKEPRKLATVPGRAFWLRWSPDGSRLRFTLLDAQTRATSLWELSAEGKNLRPLLPKWNNPPAECCGNWTPDGHYFVFQAARDGATNIWALPEASSFPGLPAPRPSQVTTGPLTYMAPVPARGQNRLFVVGAHARSELLRYDAAAGRFVRYLPDLSTAGRAEFSRDGRLIAWVSTTDGSLWQSRLDGNQRIQLTSRPMQVYMMRWSPDARRIAFMGKEPGQPWRIYVVSADGGSPQVLYSEQRSQADPGWSPDGNAVVFGRSPEYMADDSTAKSIHILDLKTGKLATLPGSAGLFSPRWSPDGRYIAAMPLDQRKLAIFDRSTEKWTGLPVDSIDNPVWSRDGKYIYFHAFMEDGKPIYRVLLAERRFEKVAEFRDVQRADAGEYTFPGLAPDDSPLVSAHLWTADIYALDWGAR